MSGGVEWWQIVATVVCIILSGTFSGLTLGLMSLDIIDLRVLTESGTERERWYAQRLLPVRRNANWLLCTLLIGNTAVNAALAIITADLFGGIAGFISSTIAILYIGEIIPQAVCHRFGLVIGAYAIPLVKLFMFLTAPLSFTTAKLLDCLLGGEPATRYNKSQLRSLLSIHGHHGPERPSPSDRTDGSDSGNNPISDQDNQPGNSMGTGQDFTVVELPKISSRPEEKSEGPGFTNPYRPSRPSWSAPELEAVQPLQQNKNGNHSTGIGESPASASHHELLNPGTGRAKKGPLSRWHGLKAKRMAERTSRKEKDRERREKDSETSTPPLTRDEMAMLGGAFDFSQKTVAQVMTALNNVFMLEASLSLNFKVLMLIFQSGHSRVPVYDKTRDNIIGVLFAKDLILLDPEDCVPIKTVLLFFNRTVLLVFDHTPLNEMLNIFKQGGGHMAIVRQNDTGDDDHDAMASVLGIVTLEDLIEELIGQDIVDETDVYTDNISKQRVRRIRSIDPEVLRMFDSKHDEELLTDKEVLVVASYLSNNTQEFAENKIKVPVLQEMLGQFPIVEYHDDKPNPLSSTLQGIMGLQPGSDDKAESDIKTTTKNPNDLSQTLDPSRILNELPPTPQAEPDITIYSRGVPTKNAYLILNGRLEISAGNDGFISSVGPWTFLGRSALTDDLYAPDFTARVCERPARLLRIPRKLYRRMVHYNQGTKKRNLHGTTSIHTTQPSLHSQKHPSNSIPRDAGVIPRRTQAEGSAHTARSLALAAAATAEAVGKPKNPAAAAGDVRMSGTASDVAVVKKSRPRANGQAIEWSEMEPMQTAEVAAAEAVGDDEGKKERILKMPRRLSGQNILPLNPPSAPKRKPPSSP